ncbi:MAG: hypothetical protein QM758_00425 [Armatimonas sp.]
MPTQETLGIRCSEVSQRHRLYGPDAPACDLDFMLIEYDRAEPVALFEHKFYRGGPKVDLDQPSIKAFSSLALRANLPAFVAQYDTSTWMYRVYPTNPQAKEYLPRTRWLTEREYAALLYQLRGREIPAELQTRLNGDPFENEEEAQPETLTTSAASETDATRSTVAPGAEDLWDEWDWDEGLYEVQLLCSA